MCTTRSIRSTTPRWARALGDRASTSMLRSTPRSEGIRRRRVRRHSAVIIGSHGMGPHYGATFLLDDILRAREAARVAPATRRAAGLLERGWTLVPERARKLLRPMRGHVKQRLGAALPDAALAARRCYATPNNVVYGGIRVNLVGREPSGRVRPGADLDRFCEELTRDLGTFVNSETGRPLVRRILRTAEAYRGEPTDHLPDLLVEWNRETPIRSVESPDLRADQPRIPGQSDRRPHARRARHRRWTRRRPHPSRGAPADHPARPDHRGRARGAARGRRDTDRRALGSGPHHPVSAPLISVVIPSFNAAAFIEETLTSVQAQTHRSLDIVVADDGSTDDTVERIARFGPAVRCLRLDHRGIGAARRAGQAAASGSYLAFLDADDIWDPEALEAQVDIARRYPESGLVICDGIETRGGPGDLGVSPERVHRGAPRAGRRRAADRAVLSGPHRRADDQNARADPHPARGGGPCRTRQRRPRHQPGLGLDYLRIAARYPLTFHRRRLVRYRYHATSASGPTELRSFRWLLRDLPVFRQQ